ncbi:MAG: TRAM domain-containing protein, partial [Cyanobacteria bacterium P01_E01_bin.6]
MNRIEEVLIEGHNQKQPNQVMGRTRTNRFAFCPGDIQELQGKLVKIRVTEVRAFSITGQRVDVAQLQPV